MSSHAPRARLTPEPRGWGDVAARQFQSIGDDHRRARRELGLPTDRPVVMAGHQLTVWHAGVLAKWIAVGALARAVGGVAAWVWVDQDEHEYSTLSVPVLNDGSRLALARWTLTDAPAGGMPVVSCPAFTPRRFEGRAALPSVERGAGEIERALREHRAASNAAEQIARAIGGLLEPFGAPVQSFFATDLRRTALFGSAVDDLRAHALAAAESYNRAIAQSPEARVGALRLDRAGGPELPLWVTQRGVARRGATLGELAHVPIEALAPRALLMTGLLRQSACDLFIHGTGGALYDRAAETWFREWRGVELAPMVTATADLFLPFGDRTRVTEADAARAAWQAHRARHDPALLGDSARATEKATMVERIRAARGRGDRPLEAYRAMHSRLAEYRAERSADLAAFDRAAAEARRGLEESALIDDRTWPFPFHEPAALQALGDQIRAQFA